MVQILTVIWFILLVVAFALAVWAESEKNE